MKQKLNSICHYLEHGLIEREQPARLSLLAALSGEHILFIGPPGTAKSELARKLHHVFHQAQYFERLLTKFSVPEELFGPLSIKALEQDRYQRLIHNYLPQASIAFIDEVFKANSAILNALLTLLNEREFDNGCERIKTPLITVLAASNELPEDESLQALYDRFLFRYHVSPITDAAFDQLLELTDSDTKILAGEACLMPEDLQHIQEQAASIPLSDEARQLILALREYLNKQSIYISDRRWRKIIKVLKVAVYTNGDHHISQWDCALLLHCVWDKPEQCDDIARWLKNYLQLDYAAVLQRFDKLVQTWERQSHADSEKRIQQKDEAGRLLFKTSEGEITTQHERIVLATRDGEVLYLAPPDQSDRTNDGKGYTLSELKQRFFDDQYQQTHINGKWIDMQNYVNNTQNRLVQKTEYEALTDTCYFSTDYILSVQTDLALVMQELQQLKQQTESQLLQLQPFIEHHLWLASSVLIHSAEELEHSQRKITDYQQRMQKVELTALSLPVNDANISIAL